jgi:hypothetical protein
MEFADALIAKWRRVAASLTPAGSAGACGQSDDDEHLEAILGAKLRALQRPNTTPSMQVSAAMHAASVCLRLGRPVECLRHLTTAADLATTHPDCAAVDGVDDVPAWTSKVQHIIEMVSAG